MINNPIGIGIVIAFLVLVALVFFIYKNYTNFKEYKWPILLIFFVLAGLMLFSLSGNYEKYVEKKTFFYLLIIKNHDKHDSNHLAIPSAV